MVISRKCRDNHFQVEYKDLRLRAHVNGILSNC